MQVNDQGDVLDQNIKENLRTVNRIRDLETEIDKLRGYFGTSERN